MNHRTLTILLIVCLLGLAVSPVLANTKVYHIRMKIPAIAGVNVPPFDGNTIEARQESFMELSRHMDVMTEEVWREGNKVILETIVPR